MNSDDQGRPPLAPAHFLVVEDDPVIGRAVCDATEGLLAARLATSGAQALAALRQHPPPRFVLLDFKLPDMDGLQVLQHVRADPRFRSLPVVVFSSLQDRELIERTLAAGADAWVQKPDDPRSLRSTVRELCLRWGHPAAAQVLPANGSPPAPSSTTTTSSTTTKTDSSTTTTTASSTTTTTSSTTTTTTWTSTTSADPGPASAAGTGRS